MNVFWRETLEIAAESPTLKSSPPYAAAVLGLLRLCCEFRSSSNWRPKNSADSDIEVARTRVRPSDRPACFGPAEGEEGGREAGSANSVTFAH